jgi:hypothetical protein
VNQKSGQIFAQNLEEKWQKKNSEHMDRHNSIEPIFLEKCRKEKQHKKLESICF